MHTSPFFHNLRLAYQAELDDLHSDSEGHHVLPQRLAEKRQALSFLLQMLTLSPEMVAVVLHQAFEFTEPELMRHCITCDADEVPSWDKVSAGLRLAPWAQPIAAQILAEPDGAWFMTVAAALEYMHSTPLYGQTSPDHADGDADIDGDTDANRDADTRADDDLDPLERHDGAEPDDERHALDREEAANAWMVEQGFDSKDPR